MPRLNKKICLITGGTQSIGASIAHLFHEEGAIVTITGRRNKTEGERIAHAMHPEINYLKLDVASETEWQAAISNLQVRYGKLDILINNAGIEQPSQATGLQNPEDCTYADWQAVNSVNLDGIFLGCKYAMQLMKNNSQGAAIVNIGSRSALVGVPSSAAYSASKAAIRNYTKTVAMYCAMKHYKIRCNIIHPAAILTNLWDKEFGHDEHRQTRIQQFSEQIPLRSMGDPLDIAYAALYLASDEAKFVTGAELIVDGGIMAGSAAGAQESLMDIGSCQSKPVASITVCKHE